MPRAMPRAYGAALKMSAQAWAASARQAGSAILDVFGRVLAAVRFAATGALLRVETAVLALAGRLGALKTWLGRLIGVAFQRLRDAAATAIGAFHRWRASLGMPAGAIVGLTLIVALAGSWLIVDQGGFDYPPAEPREVAGVFTSATPSPNPLPRGERAYIGADSKKEPSPLAGEGRVRGRRDRRIPFTVELSPHLPPATYWYGEAEEEPTAIVTAPADPSRPPQWLANAVPVNPLDSGPMIAIVIDDIGVAQARSAAIIDLPPPLTLAVIPYGENLDAHTRRARERGHELLLHIPMEPSSADADPGPNALLTGLGRREIMRRLEWGMGRLDGYVGVSNHMGSRFMARQDLVGPVLSLVRERGLMFLDSRTAADTVGAGLARSMGIPNASRDVFLDNEPTLDAVRAQLALLERIARRQGYAVGIGHPYDVTREALAGWLPAARRRGIVFVPITAIVRHLEKPPTTLAGQG